MDEQTEKKWFVFVVDHHTGPHSLNEIGEQIRQGVVNAHHFVWKEGMPDWRLMHEVRDFDSLLQPPPLPPSPPAPPILQPENQLIQNEPTHVMENFGGPHLFSNTATTQDPAQAIQVTDPLPPFIEGRADDTSFLGIETGLSSEKKSSFFKKAVKFLFFSFLFLIILGAGLLFSFSNGWMDPLLSRPSIQSKIESAKAFLEPFLFTVVDRYPSLNQWITLFPPLESVSPQEYEELKSISRINLDQDGARFALALSQKNLGAPSFYIATNIKDGLALEIHVVGNPDTLVNQLSFETRVSTNVSKRLAETSPLRGGNGAPLPRGEYWVYLPAGQTMPSSSQGQAKNLILPIEEGTREVKVLAVKSYFLGGPRDESYVKQLTEFHEKLRAKASGEIMEAKQFADTLANQLTSTGIKFGMLSRVKRHQSDRKAWAKFDQDWTKFETQLDEMFARWTPDILQKEMFYGALYEGVQRAGKAVSKVHSLQSRYIEGVPANNAKAFELELAQAASDAQKILAELQNKIEQAEKLPATPGGLPGRLS